ncbi:hypothetical protein FHX49_002053 [Microbacterium endophyticum]|uniref:DUF4839 domain-containing protein n=1 Tax=Microbacterium endophyticum TaxID=1526412 RepID=A0A7W4YMR9_9MICO|nr:DUF4839 domain-containing protein [Microbacterium endophyticum]MBB2976478.1 hypothetical protein [Microbacterium endophyticum]NIK35924.1 hypothetical protein [Microbacterium endophyticum]
MVDEEIAYETNTVRAIRGMEARTVAKWESEGWELVSQKPGKLQTEITFRRPKKKTRWVPWAVGGGVLAIALALIITFGVIGERNAALDATPSAAPSEPSVTTSEAATPEPTTPEAEPTEEADVVLTPETNAELAALLILTDYCDPSIATFASTYRGQTIAFPGYIGALAPHDGATTRYDILIGAGDFSETSAPGPAFQFRDVNTTNDLNFAGAVPDTIGVGTNLNVTAEVGTYETSSCLFLLDPISTAVR